MEQLRRLRKISITYALQEGLASENRQVLSEWRAALILRRASEVIPTHRRRWKRAPTTQQVHATIARLARIGEITRLPEAPYLYRVTSPFAQRPIEMNEIILESHPYATLSFYSALMFHNMTDDLPKESHVTIPKQGSGGLIPPGSSPDDWQALEAVPGRIVDRVQGIPVHWHRISSGRIFGHREYAPLGYPVRVTTPERTLLDALLHPDWCGGMKNVLLAWAKHRDLVDIEAIVDYTERLDIAVLRQRAGYLLEELGLSHPTVSKWPAKAHRGGSSKLSASAPFSPTYSERWQLSINAPVGVLHGSIS